MTDQKHRLSALGLQHLLGLGSYRTAWLWLQKLRRAMVRPSWDRLGGQVEVDETYVGGVESRRRRHMGNKVLVAIAAQIDGKGIGRIRLRRITSASAIPLVAFVKQVVKPGSVVITDGWDAYAGLKQEGFEHRARMIGASSKATVLLPRVHRVASLFNRWLWSTHQGALSREQLDSYLDEFTFRFNRRTSKYRGMLFYRLVAQAVGVEPLPSSRLIAGTS
jgi:transposase-like protein